MTSSRDIKRNQLASLGRRDFVRAAGGCAALSSTSIMSTLLNLKASNAAYAAQGGGGLYDGYKAMVCVFLFGGADTFNVLVPYEQGEYDDYYSIRGNPDEGGLSLGRDSLLPVTARDGRKFGVHPGMPEIKEMYDQGNCAFIANVGSLIQPTTMDDYRARKDLPLGLFSHADLIRHWQTSLPQSRSQATGWAGRMADIVTDTTNDNENISMNISLSGVTVYETGRNVVPYVVQTNGATELYGYGSNNAQDRIYSRVTDGMLAETYSDLLQKTYARTRRNSVDAAIEFNNAVNGVNLQTEFPQSFLGAQMKMIAKTIGARQVLGQRRQIFFVTVGGWDHHDEVLANQERMLPDVSKCLKAFYDATVELAVDQDTVAYTASDFGRTLSSNGRGSDHAWGGNQIAVGGAVNGAEVFGSYPTSLASAKNTDLDVGRGRVIPTTSVDEHSAELALWYGIKNDSTLEAVLPNIRNFYDANNPAPPIGFMGKTFDPPPGFPPPGDYPPPPGDPGDPPGPPEPPTPPDGPGGGDPSGPGGGGPGGPGGGF